MNFDKILVLGYGSTGYEIEKYLKRKNYNYLIVDDLQNNNYILTTEQYLDLKQKPSLIIKSPGIKYDHKLLLKYNDVQITNDIELSYIELKNKKTKIIGITATNGKTSTTTLLNEVLIHAGFKSKACGNIGMSPLHYIEYDLDYIVMELSSFQLMAVENFTTYTAFILNIKSDHLDYHKTVEDYIAAKLNIIKNGSLTNKAYIGNEVKVNNQNLEFILPQKLPIDYLKIDNGLNPENVELIALFLRSEGISLEYLTDYLYNNFKGIEHRVEFVDVVNEVTFINDSKATNVEAASLALSRLENIILLVGGYDKGEDLTQLKKYVNNVKQVISFGESRNNFSFIENIIVVENLEEATNTAYKIAKPNDCILLSPCCASYDQFKNYVERGQKFKDIVRNLK